jgi:hypothetical protein
MHGSSFSLRQNKKTVFHKRISLKLSLWARTRRLSLLFRGASIKAFGLFIY